MSLTKERRYSIGEVFPIHENLDCFAPYYEPEPFTDEERYYLTPFWTNLNKPVFAANNLPVEIPAALASRYSRATETARRLFWKEYVSPILYPEKQTGWDDKTEVEKDEAKSLAFEFKGYVDYLHEHGGLEKVVNVQRSRKFFDRWLAGFGDDSIAEMGSVNLFIEGASNIAVNEIEKKRVGISPIEKSSRYVSFADKLPNGEYQYVVPGEIVGTPLEEDFKNVMDLLFGTYDLIDDSYLMYIKSRYPRGDDETESSFNASRSAKRFDDIRDLLPFATRTNVGLNGNGRAFEDLVNRMLDHEIGEVRYWGKMLCRELEQVVPSFMTRPQTLRGAETQVYRSNMKALSAQLAEEVLGGIIPENQVPGRVQLVDWTQRADVEVLSAFIYPGDNSGFTMEEIREAVASLTPRELKEQMKRIFKERNFGKTDPAELTRDKVRFRKVPKAFEAAHYWFEVWTRGGDFRDLHRHRQLTQDRKKFTTKNGYDLEKDVINSPFIDEFRKIFRYVEDVFNRLEEISPDIAQYAVPFAFVQQFYMNMTARELYWIAELRTGPQGRPEYRKVVQEMVRQAKRKSPNVFAGIKVDNNDYSLSRRESEKRSEQKRKVLGKVNA